MTLTAAMLADLICDAESVDPIEFGNLAFDEAAARALIATHIVENTSRQQRAGMSVDELLVMSLAASGRLILENFALHVRELTRTEQHVDVPELLRKISRG
jgi:hypothetical protein